MCIVVQIKMTSKKRFDLRNSVRLLYFVSLLLFASGSTGESDRNEINLELSSSSILNTSESSSVNPQPDVQTRMPTGAYFPSIPKHGLMLNECFSNIDCTGDFEYCNYDHCSCFENYQHINGIHGCVPCPGEGRPCTNCCNSRRLECLDGICTRCISDDDVNLCDTRTVIFVTASQVALLAALVMGVAALATLLYRICTRPNLFSARHNNSARSEIESPFQRFNRPSLSSIQVRVLARLCDRPPKYESHTNYAHRIQTDEQNQSREGPNTDGGNPLPPIIGNQPPPAYDGERNTINELPPPYAESCDSSNTTTAIDSNSHTRTDSTQVSIINENESIGSTQTTTEIRRKSIKENQSPSTTTDLDKAVHI